MIFIRTSLISVLGVYSAISAESTPKTSPTTNTWAKPATSSGHGSSKPQKSKLDDFSAIDKKKRQNHRIEVMITFHPELKEQQILGRFYRADKPSIQSDCLLYEKK